MFDFLYDNIGGKIKSAAGWTFIVETIVLIITGIVMAIDNYDGVYFLISIFGPIVAWVSSWILYAFGELVEDVHAIRIKGCSVIKDNATPNVREDEAFKVGETMQTEEKTSEIRKTTCIVGRDIPEGKHLVVATQPNGGMVHIVASNGELLDRVYVKQKEKIKVTYGSLVKLYDCEFEGHSFDEKK